MHISYCSYKHYGISIHDDEHSASRIVSEMKTTETNNGIKRDLAWAVKYRAFPLKSNININICMCM